MNSDHTVEKTASLRQHGFCVFDDTQTPFSHVEWKTICALALGDPSRFIEVSAGDTSEQARVLVHRLLHDGNPPIAVDRPLAAALMEIIGSPSCMALYERVLGTSPLVIRRVQAHILQGGGFIGRHIDSESNSHYLAAVVLLLERAQAGGAFVIYRGDDGPLEVPNFSMLITDADLPHEVLPVIDGQRCTLAFWLAHAHS